MARATAGACRSLGSVLGGMAVTVSWEGLDGPSAL